MDKRGSIHQVARLIRQAPCNGWAMLVLLR